MIVNIWWDKKRISRWSLVVCTRCDQRTKYRECSKDMSECTCCSKCNPICPKFDDETNILYKPHIDQLMRE